VDARLHYLQGKTERVNDLLALLQDFYRDKLTSLLRHQDGSRFVEQYDVNNTYQYIVNRDEAQLSWVAAAITELGGSPPEPAPPVRAAAGDRESASRAVIEGDARDAQTFVDRWTPRIEAMTNARHAKMLGVIVGEVLEQKRSFEQALAGRTDMLGRRDVLEPSHGEVLASRWIE
jgi:hypothetical protein